MIKEKFSYKVAYKSMFHFADGYCRHTRNINYLNKDHDIGDIACFLSDLDWCIWMSNKFQVVESADPAMWFDWLDAIHQQVPSAKNSLTSQEAFHVALNFFTTFTEIGGYYLNEIILMMKSIIDEYGNIDESSETFHEWERIVSWVIENENEQEQILSTAKNKIECDLKLLEAIWNNVDIKQIRKECSQFASENVEIQKIWVSAIGLYLYIVIDGNYSLLSLEPFYTKMSNLLDLNIGLVHTISHKILDGQQTDTVLPLDIKIENYKDKTKTIDKIITMKGSLVFDKLQPKGTIEQWLDIHKKIPISKL